MDLRTPALPRVIPSNLIDACIALVLALAGGLSGLNVGALGGHDPWVAVAVLIAMGLVLYPRRRYPEVVLTAEAAGVGVLVALGVKLDAAFLSVLVSSYSAAVYGSRRTARVLLAATVAIAVAIAVPTAFSEGNGVRALLPVPTLIAAAGAWGVGLVIRRQLALRDTAVRARGASDAGSRAARGACAAGDAGGAAADRPRAARHRCPPPVDRRDPGAGGAAGPG
jgi:hypothetical protein